MTIFKVETVCPGCRHIAEWKIWADDTLIVYDRTLKCPWCEMFIKFHFITEDMSNPYCHFRGRAIVGKEITGEKRYAFGGAIGLTGG